MTDVRHQLRGYGEQLEAAMVTLGIDEVRTQRVGAGPVRPVLDRPFRPRVPRWVAAVVAAGAVVIVGLLVLVGIHKGPESPVVDQPTVTTIGSAPTTPVDSGLPLTPSGLTVVASGSEFFTTIVSDGSGLIWGYGPAGVLRFDPAARETTTWTAADDAWFGPGVFRDIAPAREGGVWLFGSIVARFDGAVFATAIEVPGVGTVSALAEASDGTLWAAIDGVGVVRWDGEAWVETGVTVGAASLIAADGFGGVWVSGATLEAAPGERGRFALVHYDGTDWVGYETEELDAALGAIQAIAPQPTGGLWLATGARGGQGPRLFHFDAGVWSAHVPLGVDQAFRSTSLAIGADGTVWASFVDALDGDLRVAGFDGQTWTTYGPDAGLDASGWVIADAVATPDGVFLGRGSELLELVEGRWSQVLPDPEAATVRSLDILIPVTDDELWGVEWDTVWHYRDGVWEGYSSFAGLPETGIRSLALGPDDTVWVATDEGVAYFDGDRWTVIDQGPANVVVSRPGGPVWVGGGSAFEDNLRLVGFERVGGTWTATRTEQPPLDVIDSMAVGTDGSVWIGSHGTGWTLPGRGLARYHHGGWEVIDRMGTSDIEMVGDIAVAPNGDVWTIVTTADDGGPFIVQYDGSEWTIHDGVLLVPGHNGFDLGHRVWIDSAGVVYVPRPVGKRWELMVFDGAGWTVRPGDVSYPISIGPDGTIWVWDGNLLRYPAG